MKNELYKQYKQYRGVGYPAVDACRWSLSQAPGVDDLDWDRGEARWTQDGFLCVAKQMMDDVSDLSYLGELSSDWERGDIALERGGPRPPTWFRPTIAEMDHFQGLRQKKMGRAQARLLAQRYVREASDRWRDYGDGWSLIGLGVSVYKTGIELGDASLFGIESDAGDAYLTTIAVDLAETAIREAKENVGRLCGYEV